MITIPKSARKPGESVRQFKARKRRELRATIVAFDLFRSGCAFVPGHDYVRLVSGGLAAMQRQCTVARWKL